MMDASREDASLKRLRASSVATIIAGKGPMEYEQWTLFDMTDAEKKRLWMPHEQAQQKSIYKGASLSINAHSVVPMRFML